MASMRLLLATLLGRAAFAVPIGELADAPENVASYAGNPFADVRMWPNAFYADQINKQAIPKMTGQWAEKAALVAKVPSFQWM
jgi:cellulose 1,4-beta-cellobiosidase